MDHWMSTVLQLAYYIVLNLYGPHHWSIVVSSLIITWHLDDSLICLHLICHRDCYICVAIRIISLQLQLQWNCNIKCLFIMHMLDTDPARNVLSLLVTIRHNKYW